MYLIILYLTLLYYLYLRYIEIKTHNILHYCLLYILSISCLHFNIVGSGLVFMTSGEYEIESLEKICTNFALYSVILYSIPICVYAYNIHIVLSSPQFIIINRIVVWSRNNGVILIIIYIYIYEYNTKI